MCRRIASSPVGASTFTMGRHLPRPSPGSRVRCDCHRVCRWVSSSRSPRASVVRSPSATARTFVARGLAHRRARGWRCATSLDLLCERLGRCGGRRASRGHARQCRARGPARGGHPGASLRGRGAVHANVARSHSARATTPGCRAARTCDIPPNEIPTRCTLARPLAHHRGTASASASKSAADQGAMPHTGMSTPTPASCDNPDRRLPRRRSAADPGSNRRVREIDLAWSDAQRRDRR